MILYLYIVYKCVCVYIRMVQHSLLKKVSSTVLCNFVLDQVSIYMLSLFSFLGGVYSPILASRLHCSNFCSFKGSLHIQYSKYSHLVHVLQGCVFSWPVVPSYTILI